MKEKKTLYPLVFAPEIREKIWGSETCLMGDTGLQDSTATEGWLAGNTLSELMDTYTERIAGDKVMSWYGRQFPLMAKVLDIRGRISLQVHPDDEIAAQRYDALGRKVFWYILEAGKDAQVWMGFRKDTDAGELYTACADGSVKKLLNALTPRPGDAWLIAPGIVHAAQDVKILEISEASEMNFRLYDWGRKSEDRMLMLEDALDFIEYRQLSDEALQPLRGIQAPAQAGSENSPAEQASGTHWVDEEEMIIHRLPLSDTLHIYTERFESFILYTCVSGEVSIQTNTATDAASTASAKGGLPAPVILTAGACALIPADHPDFFLVPRRKDTVLLEAYIARNDTDAYINPDVPAELEEETDTNLS
ncbi:MAG: class I mannose-6-phosphate isomerase [Bacteroidales bacterium]|nr:class I mannose-6-phosphate isomerase [Bacteroidales bacterium]